MISMIQCGYLVRGAHLRATCKTPWGSEGGGVSGFTFFNSGDQKRRVPLLLHTAHICHAQPPALLTWHVQGLPLPALPLPSPTPSTPH